MQQVVVEPQVGRTSSAAGGRTTSGRAPSAAGGSRTTSGRAPSAASSRTTSGRTPSAQVVAEPQVEEQPMQQVVVEQVQANFKYGSTRKHML